MQKKIEVSLPADLLAKVKKVAEQKNIDIETAIVFLLKVDIHL
jgi:hypothetical protein